MPRRPCMVCAAQSTTPLLLMCSTHWSMPAAGRIGGVTPINVCTSCGRLAASASDGADHVYFAAADMADQRFDVVEQFVHRPFMFCAHRCRTTEAAQVEAHHAVVPRKMRHPGTPGFTRFGKAMHEQHGLGLLPGIGVVVDGVKNVAAVEAFEGVFHAEAL